MEVLQLLEERISEAIRKTRVSSAAQLARFIPDAEGFALHHTVFSSMLSRDPEWVSRLLNDEILIPRYLKQYPARTRASEKIKRSKK